MPEPEQFLYLTTRGRKTGQAREIEIWFTQYEGRYYLIAEHPTSNWLRNLQADPKVEFHLKGPAYPATARILSPKADAPQSLIIQTLFQKKYNWSEGTIVEITPTEPIAKSQ